MDDLDKFQSIIQNVQIVLCFNVHIQTLSKIYLKKSFNHSQKCLFYHKNHKTKLINSYHCLKDLFPLFMQK